jgi:hypothetical protein
MLKGPVETVQVDVSSWLLRAMRFRPLSLVVGSLTGVSITFSPFWLFMLGRGGASLGDWRVLCCFMVTYLVPMVYIGFGGPVLQVAWKRRSAPGIGAPLGSR